MKKSTLTIVLLCASLCATAQTNEIYKWVDADGNVTYGDRPDSDDGAAIETVQIASSRTNPTSVQAGIDARHEREEQRAQQREEEAKAQQEAEKLEAEHRAQQEQCAAYRERMVKFTNARRLYKTDENGERAFLDAAETQKARSDLQARIDETCAGL